MQENKTPIGLIPSTTNRPQVSHFENIASMDAIRVRVRGGQREREKSDVEEDEDKNKDLSDTQRHVSDDIRATLVDHVINPVHEGGWTKCPP